MDESKESTGLSAYVLPVWGICGKALVRLQLKRAIGADLPGGGGKKAAGGGDAAAEGRRWLFTC